MSTPIKICFKFNVRIPQGNVRIKIKYQIKSFILSLVQQIYTIVFRNKHIITNKLHREMNPEKPSLSQMMNPQCTHTGGTESTVLYTDTVVQGYQNALVQAPGQLV